MSAMPPSNAASLDVRRFLLLLHEPGDVFEIRIPKYGKYKFTASGYFDDVDAAATAVARWDGKASVYTTLNPANPSLLARAVNKIVERAEATTADADVLRRRWLFLDLDAVRPSGISSTDDELAQVQRSAEEIGAFLRSRGWPAPILVASGNGAYLLYRVDLPNDEDAGKLVTAVLGRLADRFDTELMKVDPAVSNASRIIGVVGTKKMKGDSTEDRPHRRSEILAAPEQLAIVSLEQLQALACNRESAAATTGSFSRTSPCGSLEEMLRAKGIEFREQPPDANGVTWYHVRQCPLHNDGRPFECGVGQTLPDGPYAGHCFHPEGAGRGWQDFKRALGLDGGDGRAMRDPAMPGVDSEPVRFARTDAGNAELFASQYADRVRHDHRRGRWLVWSGHRWVDDADAEVVRLAIVASRHRGLSAVSLIDFEERKAETRFAIASENGARIEAMLKIGKAQPSLADKGDQWDADPWLLGVSNGVVDLRTGALRAGERDDRITMHSDIEFDAGASAPRWERFLNEVFNDDAEMIAFIQQAIGYSLTGDTREQCMFLCHGTGANGKSVFLAILKRLAGRYAFNAPFSSFERQHQSSIPNDLAALVGRRLVTSSETNEGTRLNEARIKALTGCDPITARFLHAEFFTFTPVAKYWLAVNHKPVVGDDSVGFWRRVRLMPFTRQFRGAAADKTLQGALEAELPGILAWAVRGTASWLAHGLVTPGVVHEATESYRVDSDPLAQFVDDQCVVGVDLSVGANELYRAYRHWAEEQRFATRETLTNTLFGSRMTMKFERRRTKRGNRYIGVGLLSEHRDPCEQGVLEDAEGVGMQGLVQGCESDDEEIEVTSRENDLTRENPEIPYTPYTPTPDEPCRCGCGKPLPEGHNKCAECAAAAVAEWRRSRTG